MNRFAPVALLLALGLAGARAEDKPVVTPVAVSNLPDFAADDLDRASLRKAIQEERRLLARNPDAPASIGGVAAKRKDLLATLERLDGLLDKDPAALAAAVASSFACWRSVGNDGKGTVLFTAYHSPCYEGSRTKTERCKWAVRRPPPELGGPARGGPPFLTRKEIEVDGKLDGRGLEIVWLANRLDAFLLEVQGSGSARLEDGTIVRMNFAHTNGHPYTSLGKELVKDGKIPEKEISIPAIRTYFAAHQDELEGYLLRNASYVFFEETKAFPTGCGGAAVTGGRSIATDKRHFPAGALAFVVVDMPVVEGGKVTGWKRRGRFVVDQDTGGAIKGPGRVDLYFGADADADAGAGVMKKEGALYYLLAR